jgi:hypothetical protein
MTPIGELGIDISQFKKPMEEAVSEVARLDKQTKIATATLALMERQFAAMGAKSGYSGKQINAQAEEVEDLNAKLGYARAEVAAFGNALEVTAKKTLTPIQSLSRLRTNIGLLFSGVAVGGLIKWGQELLRFGSQIKDTSLITGTLPESLQRVQVALSKKLSAEDTATALHSLYATLNEAKKGSTDAQDKLAQLGITLDDIKTKSPDQILIKLGDSVKYSSDKFETLRTISAVFGDDMAAKLIPALEEGSKALQDEADKAHVASDATVDAAKKGELALQSWGEEFKRWALTAIGAISDVAGAASNVKNTDTSGKPPQFGFMLGTPQQVAKAVEVAKANDAKANAIEAAKKGKEGTPEYHDQTEDESAAIAAQEQLTKLENDRLAITDKSIALQEREAEIARRNVDPAEKQNELIGLRIKKIDIELTKAQNAGKLAQATLNTEKQKLIEQQRGQTIADKNLAAQKALSDLEATRGIGFAEEQKMLLARIDAKKAEAAAAIPNSIAQKQALADMRSLQIEYVNANFQRSQELSTARLQTIELQAQFYGMVGLAGEAAVRLKYENQIAAAQCDGNTELVKQLQTQRDIELIQAKAAAHHQSAGARAAARFRARREISDAAKEDAKQNELRSRANTPGLILPKWQQDELKARDQMAAQAAKNNAPKPIDAKIDSINSNVQKMADAMSAGL